MKNDQEIRRYLTVIKKAVMLIESALEDDHGLLEQLVSPSMPQQLVTPAPPNMVEIERPVIPQIEAPVRADPPGMTAEQWKAHQIARKKHIDDLMAIDCWPEAVKPYCMASPSEEDQVNRAAAVLDMMTDRPLVGLRFLDFGCGEGWIAQEATKRGVAESVGYDIELHATWKNRSTATYTHIYNELKRSYYDVVMLYDVLDHCQDPIVLMNQVKSVLKPEGVVYVRCHPWTSAHGNHLYKLGMNKAYLHLFLNYDELRELIGQAPLFTRIEKNPLEAYHWWFHDFDIKREKLVTEKVNPFFQVPAFKELLGNEQAVLAQDIDEFLKRMEIQFVDYVLLPKR